ncbi:MAG: hypothetical protein MZW92_59370 [Comamonadaceae bacterium]|nr:hypothetical protein [Comamonadaceae bacterium]
MVGSMLRAGPHRPSPEQAAKAGAVRAGAVPPWRRPVLDDHDQFPARQAARGLRRGKAPGTHRRRVDQRSTSPRRLIMSKTLSKQRAYRLAMIAGIGAALAGCGGGWRRRSTGRYAGAVRGQPRQRGPRQRAGAMAVMGTGSLPFTAGATASERAAPLLQRVVATAARQFAAGVPASAAMKRPLVVIGPEVLACCLQRHDVADLR